MIAPLLALWIIVSMGAWLFLGLVAFANRNIQPPDSLMGGIGMLAAWPIVCIVHRIRRKGDPD